MKNKMSAFKHVFFLSVALAFVASLFVLPKPALAAQPSISYRTHCQTYGWQGWVRDGEVAGTTGQFKRLEAINIAVDGAGISGGVAYRVHCQTYGWMGEVADGAQAGTTGQSKRLEAIEIRLTGDLAKSYDVEYRVHCQTYGWMGWVKNGALAGTTGQFKRLEAIQVRLVPKAAVDTSQFTTAVSYQSHAQTYGWLGWMHDGDLSGTTGQYKRLEAVRIGVNPGLLGLSGGIRYRAHCQTYGWQGWVSDGEIAGTTGESKRMEAIQVELTGELASKYDVYYQAHCQTYGWLPCVKNGEVAGTTGQSKRIEALRIKILPKDSIAPENTADNTASIMGQSRASQDACIRHYNSVTTYPADVYGSNNRGAGDINTFIAILFEEAAAEGVRADVVYAQAMLETNYLRFGGDVKAEQCNFAGIGATGGGVPGNSFPDVRTGLRAQIQHLKAYASKDPLVNECVDPRFHYVERGVAPTLGALSGRWATGSTYGRDVNQIVVAVDSMS